MRRIMPISKIRDMNAKVCMSAGTVRILDFNNRVTQSYFEAFEDGGDLLLILKDEPTEYSKRILKAANKRQFYIGHIQLTELGASSGSYEYFINENSVKIKLGDKL